ncbi:aminodeoxychorismate synthase, component I [Cupriavidus pauculus]|uniref:Aminodeoxychorismate synthase, component I n=2 Tax=Cupriavidus pauculus TaxID=82633 RepID=A0A2N5C745_9BURK|nr:aminodeoxychorismate synthase, component I [Cupriavidus pauculus]
MSTCRFENAIDGEALALYGLRQRIVVRTPADLPRAMDAIETSRRQGYWTALLLSYSLGEWLEPSFLQPAGPAFPRYGGAPRLVALVFDRAQTEALWRPPAFHGFAEILSARPRMHLERYKQSLARIREWIEAGDVYQVNFTFPMDVAITGCPAALYRELIDRHPAAHAAYICDEGRHVLSFSPELFLRREGGRLISRPMKGTAPRHADPVRDEQAGRMLRTSVKDRAENAMIVDLMRNDMGRIARVGSVSVSDLFELERYPSVWTMTSTIHADVGQATLLEILRALFPCGSVTGAPKIAAMRYIRALETWNRGLYCGSIGWMAPNGDFSLNVAIRTLVVEDSGLGVYGVGGGIVADSHPELEWLECQWKSRILRTSDAGVWNSGWRAAAA